MVRAASSGSAIAGFGTRGELSIDMSLYCRYSTYSSMVRRHPGARAGRGTVVPVRILHVTDCYRPMMGGIETQVSHLAAHQARDHEVAVFTTTAAHPGAHGRSREQHDDVYVYRVAARMPLGIPVHPCAPRHLRDLIGRLDPDAVSYT